MRAVTLRPADLETHERASEDFAVRLDNFEGPFDLLLRLIAKHELDITEVALSQVTDEYVERIRALGADWDLGQTSSFLLVAATLLDLKAARLLPRADVDDEADLAALEARDLLFARLLQYRAYKQVAAMIQGRMTEESRRHGRPAILDEQFAALLPEVLVEVGVDELAAIAAQALAPKTQPVLALEHLHMPQVSVQDQAMALVERLRRVGTTTFRSLCSDSPSRATTVARFLALLELYREGAVSFEQLSPLAELSVRWVGHEAGDVDVSGEFDAGPVAAPLGEQP